MQPKKKIAGKTVLLTGAGGGIGRELAIQLAAEGCRLINNAGLLNPVPFLSCDDERMSAVVDVNLKALFWTTKAFLPRMLERGRGHIVTLGSVASIIGAPALVDYAASKFAAFGFMESLCSQMQEQGHTNIHFTTVCPYYCRTPLINELTISDARLPLLDVEYVARRVVQGIRMEQRVVIVPPFMCFLFFLRGVVPWTLFQSIVLNRRCKFA
ncbi:Epidermal retinol dehydrogenase 2-like protein [Aphelenchoides fujianensis]|nr:Epidermal retinol dehydrogenase 2-like protein [Aphelenchoides fujianensis]